MRNYIISYFLIVRQTVHNIHIETKVTKVGFLGLDLVTKVMKVLGSGTIAE
jgi:hypothetical protein